MSEASSFATTVLKATVVVALSLAFMVAINVLLGLVRMALYTSLMGEIFGVISCCLPFDAAAVFGSLFSATTAILSFLVAKKIFELSTWGVSAT